VREAIALVGTGRQENNMWLPTSPHDAWIILLFTYRKQMLAGNSGYTPAPAILRRGVDAFRIAESEVVEQIVFLRKKIFACGRHGEARGAKIRNLNAGGINQYRFMVPS